MTHAEFAERVIEMRALQRFAAACVLRGRTPKKRERERLEKLEAMIDEEAFRQIHQLELF